MRLSICAFCVSSAAAWLRTSRPRSLRSRISIAARRALSSVWARSRLSTRSASTRAASVSASVFTIWSKRRSSAIAAV
eukprot:641982-Pleurochrysis_carterae.AAC.2